MPVLAEPDHLVLGAATLAQGVEYVADLTGVTPLAGGQHVAMGTHNALVSLGPRTFLEVIAIDPDGKAPSRPRWFALDDVRMRAQLAEGPRLLHWVARTIDIAGAVNASRHEPGPVHPMARGDFRWKITIPDDGQLPGAGLIPTLIEWSGADHPAARLPDVHLRTAAIAGEHPDPAPVRAALAALGLSDSLKVTYGRYPRLAAMIRTPRGIATL
jgi:hypothetical protein